MKPDRQTYRDQLVEHHCGCDETSEDQFKRYDCYREEAYKNHVVNRVNEHEYYCAEPGTHNMSFRVMFPPGATIIYGDIGEMIVEPYGLKWLINGGIRSPSYFWQKVRTKVLKFNPADAAAHLDWLAEEVHPDDFDVDDDVKHAARMWAEWDPGIREEHELETAWYEACNSVECESIICEGVSSNDLQCYQALKWFCFTGLRKGHL